MTEHCGGDGHRWRDWAQSLLARHRLVGPWQEALAMILVHPLPRRERVHERWLVWSHQCFPEMHLAIHPNLRETAWRDPRPGSREHLPRMREGRFPQQQSRLTLNVLHPARDSTTLPVIQAASGLHAIASPASWLRAPEVATRAVKGWEQLDLQTIVRRFHSVDEITYRQRRGERVEERVLTIARQLMRQTQRIEERIDRTPAVVTRQAQPSLAGPAVPAVEEQVGMTSVLVRRQPQPLPAVPAEPTAAVPPAATGTPTNMRMQHPTAMPAIDLEQLTDQVMRQMDRRMTAWRERRGRI